MYETPRLERFGTFRDLTEAGGPGGSNGNSAKKVGLNDLATVLNPNSNGNSPNTGCNPRARPWSHAGGCRS